jgi:hypothetical protein
VVVLDDRQARAAGQLCGLADSTDIGDASVAVAARERAARVLTQIPTIYEGSIATSTS